MTYLANNPLFHGVSPETLSRGFDGVVSHLCVFRKGDILARQGDVCNRLIILLKGSVRGEMIDYLGRLIKVEDIIAPRVMAPLLLFGTNNRYPVEITANEATEIFGIPKESVLKLFWRNERFLENHMNFLANCARIPVDKLFFISFKAIRQKLASYLLRTSKQQEGNPILFNRSQQELAGYFEMSHPSLARGLTHMQDDGPIRTDWRLVHILGKGDLMQLIQQNLQSFLYCL